MVPEVPTQVPPLVVLESTTGQGKGKVNIGANFLSTMYKGTEKLGKKTLRNHPSTANSERTFKP